MTRLLRNSTQSLLKLLNSFIGMVDIAMILNSFIYTLLGLGVTLCLITYSGHVAGCCLYLYITLLFFLLMLEAGVTTDVFFNHDWEEDFPVEPTESFNKFEDFVRCVHTEFEHSRVARVRCLYVTLTVAQKRVKEFGYHMLENTTFHLQGGLCVVLAVLLKAVGPYQNYESDDDIDAESRPLLKNDVHPTYVVGRSVSGSKSIA
ncbi:tetraspanin-19 [Gossypium hirsutum]|uniref:Tetraspanin-19 n=1 Tax=Gossypium hirsutum TaxID=3635 RepID=A0ABM3BJF1_GOSHI|nr:tetraspanin-19-like [Gossypium hirsutum]